MSDAMSDAMPDAIPTVSPAVTPVAPSPSPSPTPQPQPASPPPPHTGPEPNPPQEQEKTCEPLIDARLHDAIKDAYTLLDFAARRSMEVTPAVRTPIIAAHRKRLSGQVLNMSEEEAFWKAFADVIEEVKPVTVGSIVFTSPPNEPVGALSSLRLKLFPPKSEADKVLRRYHAIALITLLMLLVLQVQWAIGMSIYNDAYKVHLNLMNSTESFLNAQQTLSVLGPQGGTAATDAKQETDDLKRAKERQESWNSVSYLRLWWWNRGMSALVPPYDMALSKPNEDPIPDTDFKLDKDGEQRIEFTRAELTLEVIANYYLVTLFALLGAMTQALRRLATDIADVSLTRGSLYAIRTRIILGIISGVCMAWLVIIASAPPPVDPTGGATLSAAHNIPLEAVSFLGAFTPWAMAFVSGYSVEIFFSALESVIETITRRIKSMSAEGPSTSATEPNAQGKAPLASLGASGPGPAPASATAPAPATPAGPAPTAPPSPQSPPPKG